jgi:hypothetical protein
VAGLAAGFRYYLFLGLIGLLLLWLVMLEKAVIGFALVPVGIGLLGLAPYLLPERWKFLSRPKWSPWMPFLILILLFVHEMLFGVESFGFSLSDWLLVLGLLLYFFAQFRLHSLGRSLTPADTRARPEAYAGDEPESRPVASFQTDELLPLAWTIPALIVAGQFIWWFVAQTESWTVVEDGAERLDMRVEVWRLFVLIWLVGGGAILIAGFLRILWLYRMSASEAGMIGHDALWAETRGEQRRTSRWLAWLRHIQARKLGRSK